MYHSTCVLMSHVPFLVQFGFYILVNGNAINKQCLIKLRVPVDWICLESRRALNRLDLLVIRRF